MRDSATVQVLPPGGQGSRHFVSDVGLSFFRAQIFGANFFFTKTFVPSSPALQRFVRCR